MDVGRWMLAVGCSKDSWGGGPPAHGCVRPPLVVGWFWFLGMLVPVIGLVQVGLQQRADRYTYLPLIGVFVMLVWGVSAAFQERLAPSDFGLRASFGFRPSGFGFQQPRTWPPETSGNPM